MYTEEDDMAANTRSAKAVDEDYVRGAWDWAVEAGQEHGIAVRVVLKPTELKGRWEVRVEAVAVRGADRPYVVARVAEQFPGPSQVTMGALILRLTSQLERVLAAGDGLTNPPA